MHKRARTPAGTQVLSSGSGWVEIPQFPKAPSVPRPPAPDHTLRSAVLASPHHGPAVQSLPLPRQPQPRLVISELPSTVLPIGLGPHPAHTPAMAPTVLETRPRCTMMAYGALCQPGLDSGLIPHAELQTD